MGEAPVAPGDSAASAAAADNKVVAVATPEDLKRLDNLWKERSDLTSIEKDYPIGPGDVLSISVPQVAELQAKRVRVSAQGNIELPLVGVVQAGGVTEAGLAKELNMKLEKFMYNPQASVFVDEYRNRQVAVIGAVSHPGLVVLNSPSETILDVITRVGGLDSAAADEIVLIPAEQAGAGTAQRLAAVAYRRLKSPILRPTNRIHPGSLATPSGCDIRRQPIRRKRRLRCCRRTRGRFRFRSKARRSLALDAI